MSREYINEFSGLLESKSLTNEKMREFVKRMAEDLSNSNLYKYGINHRIYELYSMDATKHALKMCEIIGDNDNSLIEQIKSVNLEPSIIPKIEKQDIHIFNQMFNEIGFVCECLLNESIEHKNSSLSVDAVFESMTMHKGLCGVLVYKYKAFKNILISKEYTDVLRRLDSFIYGE